jgi:tryptophanyl-tRNA synthetase
VTIYAALSDRTPHSVVAEFAGKGFGAFKPALADLAVSVLAPIRDRLAHLLDDRATVAAELAKGAARANALAAPTLKAAQVAVGLQV